MAANTPSGFIQDETPQEYSTYLAVFDTAQSLLKQGLDPRGVLNDTLMAAYAFHCGACRHPREIRKAEFLKIASDLADALEGVIKPN